MLGVNPTRALTRTYQNLEEVTPPWGEGWVVVCVMKWQFLSISKLEASVWNKHGELQEGIR